MIDTLQIFPKDGREQGSQQAQEQSSLNPRFWLLFQISLVRLVCTV